MSDESIKRFSDRIIELLEARPFEPFDIKTSDGRMYTVDSSEHVSRNRHGDIVTYWTPEDDRPVMIRVAQIVSVELANRPAA